MGRGAAGLAPTRLHIQWHLGSPTGSLHTIQDRYQDLMTVCHWSDSTVVTVPLAGDGGAGTCHMQGDIQEALTCGCSRWVGWAPVGSGFWDGQEPTGPEQQAGPSSWADINTPFS